MQAKSNPYVDFAARLQRAFNRTNIPPGRGRVTQVANQFGVSRETARLWLGGGVMPELPRLIEIADFCDASFDWLATGRGRIEAKATAGVRDDPAAAGHYSALSEDERLVLAAMRDLRPHRRKGLVALLS